MQGVSGALATLTRGSDRRLAQLIRGRSERRPHADARSRRLHAIKQRIEFPLDASPIDAGCAVGKVLDDALGHVAFSQRSD